MNFNKAAVLLLISIFFVFSCNADKKAEPSPQAKPEAEPAAKPETKPAAKPETKPEAKPEAKPETKPEAKPEAKPETKPEAESKPEPQKAEPSPVEKPAAMPEATWMPDELLVKLSTWLPRDTFIISLLDAQRIEATRQDAMEAILDGVDLPAMQKDISDLLIKRLGPDLTRTEWILIGTNPGGFVVIWLGGDFGDPLKEMTEVDGLKVHRSDEVNLWLVDAPDVGALGLLFAEEHVRQLAQLRKNPAMSLEGSAQLGIMKSLLERRKAGFALAVAHFLHPKLRANMARELKNVEPPKGAVISLSNKLVFEVTGDPKTLAALLSYVELAKGLARMGLNKAMQEIDKAPLSVALATVMGKHLLDPMAKALTPTIEGSHMWLEVPTPLEGVGSVALIGVAASVAIPAYIKYLKRARASEALHYLDTITSAAARYYATPRVDPATGKQLACAFPPNAGPSPRIGTCCGELGGPDADKDDACDPDPGLWQEKGWQAIDFSITDPHRYVYQMEGNGLTGAEAVLTVRVIGDLDCDGDKAVFERRIFGRIQGKDCVPQVDPNPRVENQFE